MQYFRHSLLLFFVSFISLSHNSPYDLVTSLDEALIASPYDAHLYFKRAQLHQQAHNLALAFRDYQYAQQYDSSSIQVYPLIFAELFTQHHLPHFAQTYLDQLDEFNLHTARTFWLQGTIFWQTHEDNLAFYYYEQSLHLDHLAPPWQYIFVVEHLLASDSSNLSRALSLLAKGQDRLGFLVSIQDYAFRIALHHKAPQLALSLLSDLLSHQPQSISYLLEKAQLLGSLGLDSLSYITYDKALAIIASLPAHRRVSPLVRQQRHTITQHLKHR